VHWNVHYRLPSAFFPTYNIKIQLNILGPFHKRNTSIWLSLSVKYSWTWHLWVLIDFLPWIGEIINYQLFKNVTLYSSHLFILFSSFLQERQPDYMDRPASINGNAQDMQWPELSHDISSEDEVLIDFQNSGLYIFIYVPLFPHMCHKLIKLHRKLLILWSRKYGC
jgi:hypothetical protein